MLALQLNKAAQRQPVEREADILAQNTFFDHLAIGLRWKANAKFLHHHTIAPRHNAMA